MYNVSNQTLTHLAFPKHGVANMTQTAANTTYSLANILCSGHDLTYLYDQGGTLASGISHNLKLATNVGQNCGGVSYEKNGMK